MVEDQVVLLKKRQEEFLKGAQLLEVILDDHENVNIEYIAIYAM